jgi:hypothetical protein
MKKLIICQPYLWTLLPLKWYKERTRHQKYFEFARQLLVLGHYHCSWSWFQQRKNMIITKTASGNLQPSYLKITIYYKIISLNTFNWHLQSYPKCDSASFRPCKERNKSACCSFRMSIVSSNCHYIYPPLYNIIHHHIQWKDKTLDIPSHVWVSTFS